MGHAEGWPEQRFLETTMHIHPSRLRPAVTALWSASPAALPTMSMFGLGIVNASVAATLDHLCERIDGGCATRVAFLNAHCVNVAAGDAQYRHALSTADLLLPDGSGVATAAKMNGTKIVANLNGTDLIPALCARLAKSGHSVYLLGGLPGVADAAAAALQQSHPGLQIAGTHDGFFGDVSTDDLVSTINQSDASVLLVAMGVPYQDTWLERMSHRLGNIVSFGVGALFDFLAGRVSRAPKVLRKMGMEWTWRLLLEPRRMWHRYIYGNPAFLLRAAADSKVVRRTTERLDNAGKRAVDVTAASLGLIALAPALVAVAAIVRMTSPGPAILRQPRIGQDGVPFTMLKFRSMYIDADARRAALETANVHGAAGVTFKLRRDPRVTPIGRLLRKSSIDEIPQLWNILRGEMTLVGPRPPLPSEVARYNGRQFYRLAAKPGVTCLWQISGRSDIAFEQQVELDIRYMQTRSLLGDLMIMLRTVPAVLVARGAY